jgi:hypothetical protein
MCDAQAINPMTHAQVMGIVVTESFAAIKEILPLGSAAFLSELEEVRAKPDALKLFRSTAACDTMVQLMDKCFTRQTLFSSMLRTLCHVLAQIGGTQTNLLFQLFWIICWQGVVHQWLVIDGTDIMHAVFG